MGCDMKVTLHIDIECGEKTCASSPGKFCQFVRTRRFGQVTYCRLFSDDRFSAPVPLETSEPDGRGWLLRHPKCLEAANEPRA